MKLAVVQHRIRASRSEDIEALVRVISEACAQGAQVVVCPYVPSITESEEDVREQVLDRLGCAEDTNLVIPFRSRELATTPPISETRLGRTARMLGDECIADESMRAVAGASVDALVMRPRSESELQAEAFLERALAASASVCGLVIVSEMCGSEPGVEGHGGSAVLLLGDVLDEISDDEDEFVLVEVDAPVGRPEVREPMPDVPPILAQRLAVHRGRKADVGYLADLS